MDINERNRGTAIFMLDATKSKMWFQQRKTARNLNGCWSLAGEGVDPDEAPSEAVLRASLGEEAAIARTPVQLAFLRKTQEDKTPTDLWCVFWYAIVLEPGEVPKPNEDLAGPWELFDIGQLRTSELPLRPGIVQMLATLEDYLESLPPTNIAAPYPCALSTVDVAACRIAEEPTRWCSAAKRTPSAGGSRAASSIAKRTGHFEKPRRVNWAKRFLAVSQPRNLKSSVPESRWMTPAIAETRTRYSQPCSCSNTSGQTIGGRAVGMICQRSSGLLLSPRWGFPASRAAPSSWRKISGSGAHPAAQSTEGAPDREGLPVLTDLANQ